MLTTTSIFCMSTGRQGKKTSKIAGMSRLADSFFILYNYEDNISLMSSFI